MKNILCKLGIHDDKTLIVIKNDSIYMKAVMCMKCKKTTIFSAEDTSRSSYVHATPWREQDYDISLLNHFALRDAINKERQGVTWNQ